MKISWCLTWSMRQSLRQIVALKHCHRNLTENSDHHIADFVEILLNLSLTKEIFQIHFDWSNSEAFALIHRRSVTELDFDLILKLDTIYENTFLIIWSINIIIRLILLIIRFMFLFDLAFLEFCLRLLRDLKLWLWFSRSNSSVKNLTKSKESWTKHLFWTSAAWMKFQVNSCW